MFYIFFNSFSKSGSNLKKRNKIINQAIKAFKIESYELKDITKIKNVKSILTSFTEKDIVILIGGDGTLTYITNAIKNEKILPKIYAYRAGTGNDFLRDLNSYKEVKIINKKFYLINDFIQNLPQVYFENKSRTFLNGVGFGVDAYIAEAVNKEKKETGHSSFFKTGIKAFKKYQPFKELIINIDGKEHKFHKVWLASIMNGKYYGKGMKIAPHANRQKKELEVLVIHNLSKFRLACLFPTVLTGRHIIYKKCVTELFGKNIEIKHPNLEFLQIDGEIFKAYNQIKIKA
ncbi:transcriptional regulator [[Mycoplasma] falconis]|uniref:Transcriptional regulator n=1 Tax=[Mycoplasma] falconis TaxID=92403 RepID=A0A501X8T6_9BACT|nr:diacylglycerol kinase family protein [[Mycoplasma] falconis]TPE56978.1 transcriptional regulator [[Mycoplasma] falconis]